MEYIKITKVDDVTLFKKGVSVKGALHLTTHHLIFTLPPPPPGEQVKGSRELWLCYPMIEKVELKMGSSQLYLDSNLSNSISMPSTLLETEGTQTVDLDLDEKKNVTNTHSPKLYEGASLRVRCRDFSFLAFDFEDQKQCGDVFDSILRLTCLKNIDKVYAFIYSPLKIEMPYNGWKLYDPINEFKRQGIKNWRISRLNQNYELCGSYPSVLLVPSTVSDNVLKYAAKYRSKARLPVLTYYYSRNGCTITRCSQPLVGLKQARSIQDEKLIQEIFKTNANDNDRNLIADARPLTNAMAQTALGAGTENMDNYRHYAKKIFLGIDNIHVVRESLSKAADALKDSDINKNALTNKTKDLMIKSNWLKLVATILSGVDILIKTIYLNNNHLLVHCSDGWDRTSQLTSLVQVCLDPYYRTIDGFFVLIEKDWLSFGHRFSERCGFLQSETQFINNSDYKSASSNQAQQYITQVSNHFRQKKHLKYTSPVFHQFLDCIYQLFNQNSNRFEFNERLLRRLLYHLYSCQYGTFLYDSEKERLENNLKLRSKSVWDYFKARPHEFTNPLYDPTLDQRESDAVIYPNLTKIKWWHQVLQVNPSVNEPTPTTFAQPVRPPKTDYKPQPGKVETELQSVTKQVAADVQSTKKQFSSADEQTAEMNLAADIAKLEMGDLSCTEDAQKLAERLSAENEGLDRSKIDDMIKEAAKELSI